MRLIKDLYGLREEPLLKLSPFERRRGLFNLKTGQLRSSRDKFSHNHGWYNCFGQKIGWGDLADFDVKEIINGLEDDEIFITVGERESYWDFVSFNKTVNEKQRMFPIGVADYANIDVTYVDPTEADPGINYVAANARWIFEKGVVYSLFPPSSGMIGDIPIQEITVKELVKKMKKYCKMK